MNTKVNLIVCLTPNTTKCLSVLKSQLKGAMCLVLYLYFLVSNVVLITFATVFLRLFHSNIVLHLKDRLAVEEN
jgi:hypothetical protein